MQNENDQHLKQVDVPFHQFPDLDKNQRVLMEGRLEEAQKALQNLVAFQKNASGFVPMGFCPSYPV